MAYVALVAVCFFWGTTYLGIRMAEESLPPENLLCYRFTLSGSALLAIAILSRAKLPSRRELLFTALFGIIIIGIGNGCLVYAELLIPSGLASLFLTTSPFWMIGIEATVPGGQRLQAKTILGLFVGLAGSVLLVAPGAVEHGFEGATLKGFLVLQLGAAAWALGSILQRRQKTEAHPVVSGAVQQLATGLVYIAPAMLLHPKPIVWTFRSAGALVYLILFGSILGYSAYIYTLARLPVSLMSVYTYVNPIVALFLGWYFYREPIGVRELLAMLVIFAGVTLVRRSAAPTAKPASGRAPKRLRTAADS